MGEKLQSQHEAQIDIQIIYDFLWLFSQSALLLLHIPFLSALPSRSCHWGLFFLIGRFFKGFGIPVAKFDDGGDDSNYDKKVNDEDYGKQCPVSKESDLLVEDYGKMFHVVTHHPLQLLVEYALTISEGYEEEVKDGIDDKRNKAAVLSPIVSHEEGIDAQLNRIDKHECGRVKGEKWFIGIDEIDYDPNRKEGSQSNYRYQHSWKLSDERIILHVLIFDLDDRYLLLYLLLLLFRLDLRIRIGRQEEGSSLGEEEEIRVFELDVVQANEKRDEQDRVKYHVELLNHNIK